MFYVLLLPYLMWAIDELVIKSSIGRKKNLTRQIILDYQEKQQIAIEESKLEDLKANYREKADLNNQINQLRNQLDERDNLINSQKNDIIELNDLIQNLEITNDVSLKDKETYLESYDNFRKSDMYQFFREVGISIRNQNSFPFGVNDIIKEKFIFQGIVEEFFNEADLLYRFTEKGNFFWKTFVNNTIVTKNIKIEKEPDDLPF